MTQGLLYSAASFPLRTRPGMVLPSLLQRQSHSGHSRMPHSSRPSLLSNISTDSREPLLWSRGPLRSSLHSQTLRRQVRTGPAARGAAHQPGRGSRLLVLPLHSSLHRSLLLQEGRALVEHWPGELQHPALTVPGSAPAAGSSGSPLKAHTGRQLHSGHAKLDFKGCSRSSQTLP